MSRSLCIISLRLCECVWLSIRLCFEKRKGKMKQQQRWWRRDYKLFRRDSEKTSELKKKRRTDVAGHGGHRWAEWAIFLWLLTPVHLFWINFIEFHQVSAGCQRRWLGTAGCMADAGFWLAAGPFQRRPCWQDIGFGSGERHPKSCNWSRDN